MALIWYGMVGFVDECKLCFIYTYQSNVFWSLAAYSDWQRSYSGRSQVT